MANTVFTVAVCDALYGMPKKMASQIVWRQESSSVFRFIATVICPADGTMLDLYGHWCHNTFHNTTRWGFSLKFLGNIVRQYDMAKRHKNPGNGWVNGPHKHRFNSSKVPRFAYKPNPPISEIDANDALMDFLTESNIELPTGYQRVMFP